MPKMKAKVKHIQQREISLKKLLTMPFLMRICMLKASTSMRLKVEGMIMCNLTVRPFLNKIIMLSLHQIYPTICKYLIIPELVLEGECKNY